MADIDSTDAELRHQDKLANERTKYLAGALSNGGLALAGAGFGLLWVGGWDWVNAGLASGGILIIFIGLGLLDFLRSED